MNSFNDYHYEEYRRELYRKAEQERLARKAYQAYLTQPRSNRSLLKELANQAQKLGRLLFA